MTLDSVVISDTDPSTCAELPEDDDLSCVTAGRSGGVGAGVVSQAGARVTVRDFRITGSAHGGLVVGRDASLRASQGMVTDNAVGLIVWDESYDVERVSEEVFLFDNAIDVAVQEVTLPVPSASIGGDLGPTDG